MVTPAFGHDIVTTKLTWTQEVSRLVYKHCVSCHREGGRAFSLTTYAEARPWAKAIRDEVLGRRMPPWGPVKGVGEFHDDASLSLPEIDMFVAWVEGGAPEGDPALLPSHVPGAATTPVALSTRRVVDVATSLTLSSPLTVQGLRPAGLQDRQSLEAWATKPDGSVERLIWLRDVRTMALRDYRFRTPVRLPRGTSVQVTGPSGSSLKLLCD
ncbi:MAG: hypothetical protein JWN34_1510 [Bryobacterales bacterium]|nr:hypothetical protein [Bryobacterales bacterium]